MLFGIESDLGTTISGYCVPDSFSGTPTLNVISDHKILLTFKANESRPLVVESGRHATGQVGFRIDEQMLPRLGSIGELEILDDDTGTLIYRRRHPETIKNVRIFRLETHLLPLWNLDKVVGEYFQYFHRSIETLGRESATQIFLLNEAKSSYASGRLLY